MFVWVFPAIIGGCYQTNLPGIINACRELVSNTFTGHSQIVVGSVFNSWWEELPNNWRDGYQGL